MKETLRKSLAGYLLVVHMRMSLTDCATSSKKIYKYFIYMSFLWLFILGVFARRVVDSRIVCVYKY